MPRHPFARRFANLFTGVTSFQELEHRIEALPSEKDRGDAFEVFAEAYLSTQKTAAARHVWPNPTVPEEFRRQLELTRDDKGVDGVLETLTGELRAYQVKFRSERESLRWGGEGGVSTFIGLTEACPRRFVFTNSTHDGLPKVVKSRRRFFAISGDLLDGLDPADFDAILAWLNDRPIEAREPKMPRPDQREAIDALVASLARHDRATAIMACGTGKTLVQLWTAERLGCQQVLVLEPSLVLLNQTLHRWLNETSWRCAAPLVVCSDPTVTSRGEDDVRLDPLEMGCPVTTDAKEVRAFLDAPADGVKVVLSTYQSAEKVAKAVRATGRLFPLVIFDEAHRTAGREGAKFSLALRNDRLPAHKRLFFTATPRHYDVRKADRAGDATLVYSMDQPDIYGPIAYTLPVARATELRIIAPYKVIISVFTTDMMHDALLTHGEVVVAGDVVKARQVATQLALAQAAHQYDVKKIITFHSTVEAAQSFVRPGGEGVATHLPGFHVAHVNGEMRASDRRALLDRFRQEPRALLSNARCLTEGVDVENIGLVAFITPKRSRVDIVQAIGRAMRCAPGKTVGYVLVPLFVEIARGESLHDAIARSGFDEVWAVLQALQTQDSVLADIVREMREERGRVGGYDESRFRERVVVLGPTVDLDMLRRAIATRVLERVGSSWDEYYGRLLAFKARFGGTNVPTGWAEDSALFHWVNAQRSRLARGQLLPERRERLDSIGFVWDAREAQWRESFDELSAWVRERGRFPTFREGPRLLHFMDRERASYRKAPEQYTSERRRLLDELGFDWRLGKETAFQTRLARVAAFVAKEGHSSLPLKHPDYWWTSEQRALKRSGELPPEREEQLRATGFDFEPRRDHDARMAERLRAYALQHGGDANVPALYPADQQLANWLRGKRRQLGEQPESAERRELEAAGVTFGRFRPGPATKARTFSRGQITALLRSGKSIKELSQELGIPRGTLFHYRHQYLGVRKWRTPREKRQILRELRNGVPREELRARYQVSNATLYRWSREERAARARRPARPRR